MRLAGEAGKACVERHHVAGGLLAAWSHTEECKKPGFPTALANQV